MPLEISDAELLDMDPELLLSLQKYLKDRRAQHPQVPLKEDATSALVANTSSKTTISEGTELVTIKSWDISSAANATLDEVEGPDGLYLGSKDYARRKNIYSAELENNGAIKEIYFNCHRCWLSESFGELIIRWTLIY